MACYGYFQGVDAVNAPCASCGGPGACVNDQPRRCRGRSAAGPALVRRMVNIQDNCGVCVRRVEFELGEVGVGVLRVEAPQDVIVLVRTERALVNGLNPLFGYFRWYIIGLWHLKISPSAVIFVSRKRSGSSARAFAFTGYMLSIIFLMSLSTLKPSSRYKASLALAAAPESRPEETPPRSLLSS